MVKKRKQEQDQQEEMQADIAGEIEVLPTPVHNREGQPAPNAHPPEVVAAVFKSTIERQDYGRNSPGNRHFLVEFA